MIASPLDIIGFVGGTTISLSLIPQVYKTFHSKSAGDISYYYQAIYIVGCTLTLIYAAALRLWPVYIPITLELTLIISLTVMKVIFDRREKKEKQELLKNNEEEDIDEEHGVIRKDNDGEDDISSKD
ncbi:hypothetical protein FRACYDRAFT_259883 [Fragilariopsis cylindrus CCMP1102]|uniref:PQ-loop-domain-containing protein n=1 Tax=Fragilariopsis cylindrus CCMP1102 TaxID=635003 RepID=A0A1E7FTB5_9STRA|nr:hypothetical protein FRACYDRAFT_259883 [Fragilariopsis cylindrus CCMP1102]|eukprot:OEU21389.1 hypothetical protein FRACYDRAFT_259883 [Fragilariopsis cylindrus CCMP1102]